MNCHDARQKFSDLLAGSSGLTESAQVDAHVSRCAECRDLLEELYRLKSLADEPEHGNDPDPSYADDLTVEPRWPRSGLRLVLVGVAGVMLGIGAALTFSTFTRSPERLSAFLTSGPRATSTEATRSTERTGSREPTPPSSSPADSQESMPAASGRADSQESMPAASGRADSQGSMPAASGRTDSQESMPALSHSLPVPAPPAKPQPASKSSSGKGSSSDRGSTTAPSGGAGVTEKHAGVVVAVDQTRITIDEMGPWHGPSTRPMRLVFQLAGTTKVALAGRKREGPNGWGWAFDEEGLRRTDLRPGDFVTVTARRSGDDAVAISVLAVRPGSKPEVPGSS